MVSMALSPFRGDLLFEKVVPSGLEKKSRSRLLADCSLRLLGARASLAATLAAASMLLCGCGGGGDGSCVKRPLRFGIDAAFADKYAWVCCDNHDLAEPSGSAAAFSYTNGVPTTYYDPACGIPLFVAPMGRRLEDFRSESAKHGWPSFRDGEVASAKVYECGLTIDN